MVCAHALSLAVLVLRTDSPVEQPGGTRLRCSIEAAAGSSSISPIIYRVVNSPFAYLFAGEDKGRTETDRRLFSAGSSSVVIRFRLFAVAQV